MMLLFVIASAHARAAMPRDATLLAGIDEALDTLDEELSLERGLIDGLLGRNPTKCCLCNGAGEFQANDAEDAMPPCMLSKPCTHVDTNPITGWCRHAIEHVACDDLCHMAGLPAYDYAVDRANHRDVQTSKVMQEAFENMLKEPAKADEIILSFDQLSNEDVKRRKPKLDGVKCCEIEGMEYRDSTGDRLGDTTRESGSTHIETAGYFIGGCLGI